MTEWPMSVHPMAEWWFVCIRPLRWYLFYFVSVRRTAKCIGRTHRNEWLPSRHRSWLCSSIGPCSLASIAPWELFHNSPSAAIASMITPDCNMFICWPTSSSNFRIDLCRLPVNLVRDLWHCQVKWTILVLRNDRIGNISKAIGEA